MHLFCFLETFQIAEFFKEHIFSQQCSDRCPSLFQQKDVVESRHLCTMEQMIAMITNALTHQMYCLSNFLTMKQHCVEIGIFAI